MVIPHSSRLFIYRILTSPTGCVGYYNTPNPLIPTNSPGRVVWPPLTFQPTTVILDSTYHTRHDLRMCSVFAIRILNITTLLSHGSASWGNRFPRKSSPDISASWLWITVSGISYLLIPSPFNILSIIHYSSSVRVQLPLNYVGCEHTMQINYCYLMILNISILWVQVVRLSNPKK
jgi:hypothetical protein